jgi:hypothetical protein
MQDLLINTDGDLIYKDNDIVIGFSDFQHQEDLLIIQKGELKETPDCGVGIENFLNDGDIDGMLSEVKSQFTKDGMEVNKLKYDEATGNLNYDANYKSR